LTSPPIQSVRTARRPQRIPFREQPAEAARETHEYRSLIGRWCARGEPLEDHKGALPGIWLQFSHLELEFYDKYFNADLYHRQAAHHDIWGDH